MESDGFRPLYRPPENSELILGDFPLLSTSKQVRNITNYFFMNLLVLFKCPKGALSTPKVIYHINAYKIRNNPFDYKTSGKIYNWGNPFGVIFMHNHFWDAFPTFWAPGNHKQIYKKTS